VEHSPYVQLFYLALTAGDISPERLGELTRRVAETPPAVALRYEHPEIARHAVEVVRELERLRRPPVEARALQG
jgi:hypothetical protein